MTSAILNSIAFAIFTLSSIFILLQIKKGRVTFGEIFPLLIAMLLYSWVCASNTLEHFGITDLFDPSEDVAEVTFTFFFLFFIYIWRKQKSLNEIQNQKFWLTETLQSIADGVMTTDSNGNIQQINHIMEGLTGWSASEAINKKPEEVLHFFDKNTGMPIQYTPFENLLNKGIQSSTSLSLMIKSKDGKLTSISEKTAIIKIDDTQVIGAVGIFRDMREYDSMVEQLTHIYKMEAIGQLTGGVAHDINNMLGGIMGATDLLFNKLNKKDREKYSQELEILYNASERASDLTSNLLAFSRKKKILSTPVSITEIIKSTVAIVKDTTCKLIPIKLDLDPDDLTIIGDPTQLQNAFLNLILNAKDAMHSQGEIVISSKVKHIEQSWCDNTSFDITPGDFIFLSFKDNGRGIPEKIKKHIFDPFYTTKDEGKGTGLGLSAVRNAVVSHNGAIEVKSEEGVGTSFNLYFPLSKEKLSERERISDASPCKSNAQILVIEDEIIIQSTVKLILEDLDYSVLIANEGDSGLELFKENKDRISVVLLDMVMPGMSGHEVFDKILEIDPNAKVILTSGFTPKDLPERCVGFIQKPFRKNTLADNISSAIQSVPKN